jgi:hypothetical protein
MNFKDSENGKLKESTHKKIALYGFWYQMNELNSFHILDSINFIISINLHVETKGSIFQIIIIL